MRSSRIKNKRTHYPPSATKNPTSNKYNNNKKANIQGEQKRMEQSVLDSNNNNNNQLERVGKATYL